MERHQKFTKCPGCDEDTKPEFPIIKFQIGLVPADQIKAEKAIGLQRKSQFDNRFKFAYLSEIGLESNSWVLIPSKKILDNENIEHITVRGTCYASCFQEELPEITLHSIMGFGSRYVEKMKILKMTNNEQLMIYNENHVNVRYQPFRVIRKTQIEVITELMPP